jgi:hypothetical protein
MSYDNYNTGNTNWTPPPHTPMSDPNAGANVPNSMGSFVLGIISLCICTVCCICYGSFAGVITSIIGLVLGNKAIRSYEENPGMYNEKSYKKAKTGRILSIISLIISIIVCAIIVTYLYLGFTDQLPPELQREFRKSMRRYR